MLIISNKSLRNVVQTKLNAVQSSIREEKTFNKLLIKCTIESPHAVQTHTALEVNANPWRLDRKDTHCKMAIDAGVKLIIGTDAHSIGGLGLMDYGVATAARGWATKADVLNTFTAAKIKNWAVDKRKT